MSKFNIFLNYPEEVDHQILATANTKRKAIETGKKFMQKMPNSNILIQNTKTNTFLEF